MDKIVAVHTTKASYWRREPPNKEDVSGYLHTLRAYSPDKCPRCPLSRWQEERSRYECNGEGEVSFSLPEIELRISSPIAKLL